MLILKTASHLDAFSAYPCQTSLPSNALGRTTGTQEVCSSRSSRTREEPSQCSTPTVDRRPTILLFAFCEVRAFLPNSLCRQRVRTISCGWKLEGRNKIS